MCCKKGLSSIVRRSSHLAWKLFNKQQQRRRPAPDQERTHTFVISIPPSRKKESKRKDGKSSQWPIRSASTPLSLLFFVSFSIFLECLHALWLDGHRCALSRMISTNFPRQAIGQVSEDLAVFRQIMITTLRKDQITDITTATIIFLSDIQHNINKSPTRKTQIADII
jgi:hypothetical protein